METRKGNGHAVTNMPAMTTHYGVNGSPVVVRAVRKPSLLLPQCPFSAILILLHDTGMSLNDNLFKKKLTMDNKQLNPSIEWCGDQ